MNKSLKIAVDPYLCADQRREYAGTISYDEMERVQEHILSTTQPLNVELSFSKDRKFIVVIGRIYGDLVLECAACLGEVILPVDIAVRLAIINDEEKASLVPELYEPWLMDDDRLMLSQLIEDELLLELPVIARHTSCPVDLPHSSSSDDYVEETEIKENPFKVLEALKKH